MKQTLSLAALLITISAAVLAPTSASAQVNVNITLGDAPPPLRFESVPAPRAGYIWAPGYWNWDGGRHVWSAGHWERVRRNEVYVRPEWRQEDGRWRFVQGGWKNGHYDKHEGKHKGKHKDKHDRDDGDRRDHDDDHRGKGNHCPPGQAKKGNC